MLSGCSVAREGHVRPKRRFGYVCVGVQWWQRLVSVCVSPCELRVLLTKWLCRSVGGTEWLCVTDRVWVWGCVAVVWTSVSRKCFYCYKEQYHNNEIILIIPIIMLTIIVCWGWEAEGWYPSGSPAQPVPQQRKNIPQL